MKFLKIFFLFFCTLLPLYGTCMEKKAKHPKPTKENVRSKLTQLQEQFTNNYALLNHGISSNVQNIINSSENTLQGKVSRNNLKFLHETLNKAIMQLNATIARETELKEFTQQLKSQKTETPQSSTSPAERQIQRPVKRKYPSLKHAYACTPEEITPDQFLTDAQEQEQQTNITSSNVGVDTNVATAPESLATTASSTLQLPKKLSTLPKPLPWKTIITYLCGTGIFTGIGIYSYYKLSSDSWNRPIYLGLSALGVTTCTLLAYKNWKYAH